MQQARMEADLSTVSRQVTQTNTQAQQNEAEVLRLTKEIEMVTSTMQVGLGACRGLLLAYMRLINTRGWSGRHGDFSWQQDMPCLCMWHGYAVACRMVAEFAKLTAHGRLT
jgi:hypothetical protein